MAAGDQSTATNELAMRNTPSPPIRLPKSLMGMPLHGDLDEWRHGAHQHAVELTEAHQPFHLAADVAKADPAQRVNQQPHPIQERDLAERPPPRSVNRAISTHTNTKPVSW